ncbi:MAG: DUF1572 family protein [Pyrinomonadaceae bacterium]
MNEAIIENYLKNAVESFRNYKLMAERAIGQISDEDFFRAIDAEANSVAVLVKHVAGNQLSRWRDFLTSDGEKPDRRRDTEFELMDETREDLMRFWERGWQTLFDALTPLTAEDFGKTVLIRGEAHTVCEAINRQMTHYAYHVGQIALLAKHFRSSKWQTLSVPRGHSEEFNRFLAEKKARGETQSHPLAGPMEFAQKKSQG